MSNYKLNVGFDLDGVGADFGADVVRYAEWLGLDYNFGPHTEPQQWDFHHTWNMSTRDFISFCNNGVDAGFIFRGPARPGFVEAVWEVHNAGHQITVITDRHFGSLPTASQAATYRWWEDHDLPKERVDFYFSADKTCVPTDVFIEDRIQNYDALIAANTPCYLVNRPWNAPYDDGRMRLTDVSEYPKAIEKIFQPA